MSKEVASKKDDFQQLNRELEVTEQACSSLQKSFQEYCPDIRHQETEVRRLRNRYSNINSQLQQRWSFIKRPFLAYADIFFFLLRQVCFFTMLQTFELYHKLFISQGHICCKMLSVKIRNLTVPSIRSLLSSPICPIMKFGLVKVCHKSMPSKTLRWSVLSFIGTDFD